LQAVKSGKQRGLLASKNSAQQRARQRSFGTSAIARLASNPYLGMRIEKEEQAAAE